MPTSRRSAATAGAAELVAEVRGADRIAMLGRRGAEPARRQGGSRSREAAGLRGHGARGGVPQARRPLAADHPRHRPQDRRAAGALGFTTIGALQQAPEACSRSASAPTTARDLLRARTSTARRRSRPSRGPRSRAPARRRSTATSPTPPSSRPSSPARRELGERLRARSGARPHDRDQGPARRLDDGHPRAHDRGRRPTTARRRPGRAGAAARVRAAAPGAAARRPRRLLRGRRGRRAGASERAAARSPRRSEAQLRRRRSAPWPRKPRRCAVAAVRSYSRPAT